MTTHMITHGLFIEAFTQSLYSWNMLALSNKQNPHFSLLCAFKTSNQNVPCSIPSWIPVGFPFISLQSEMKSVLEIMWY